MKYVCLIPLKTKCINLPNVETDWYNLFEGSNLFKTVFYLRFKTCNFTVIAARENKLVYVRIHSVYYLE